MIGTKDEVCVGHVLNGWSKDQRRNDRRMPNLLRLSVCEDLWIEAE